MINNYKDMKMIKLSSVTMIYTYTEDVKKGPTRSLVGATDGISSFDDSRKYD